MRAMLELVTWLFGDFLFSNVSKFYSKRVIFAFGQNRTIVALRNCCSRSPLCRHLCQCGHVLEAQFVGLAQHPVHEEAEDAEDRVEAHVGGHGP